MSPAAVRAESQEDRVPPCLFPTLSSPIPALSEELLLEETLDAVYPALKQSEITLPSALQTAWALTLRCFVPTDILSFAYSGGNDFDHGVHDVGPVVVFGRVDNSESLAVCLQRFKETEVVSSVSSPNDYEIRAVSQEPTREVCNTALLYNSRADGEPWVDRMDLAIRVYKTSSGQLCARAAYQMTISASLAKSVLHTFKHVLSQVFHGPHNREADLCSNYDKSAIRTLTQTISPAHDRCLHEMIVDQCRTQPDRLAVRSWDGDLTYGELDDLSLRLAHHLVQQLGVGPEKFVLSCFEKSTMAIVARLAVLRAGGAYISIHAVNPPIYLDSVIQRTNSQVLLSDVRFANRFQHLVPNFVGLTMDSIRSLPVNPAPACDSVRPDNACLVLFTSGSTGQPKGIIQVHQTYATAILDYARNLHLDASTRFLHFDDYAFDISNLEFLAPLVLGGCCCVPRPMKTPEDIVNAVTTLQPTITFLTPTVAIKLDPADVPSLKTICVGGEPLPKDLITKWKHSSTHLINQYGMGEVAVCCAYNNDIKPGYETTIGRPSTGAIWIVDPSTPEKLLPLGAVGEIIIEGPHLSRRYLDNTAVSRTAAGFLSKTPRWMADLHPSRNSSTRMYRSGDLGRLNPDGTIDYIGRKDTILKLDGCRIDAVEVEHQARKCLSPRDAIVIDLLGAIDGVEDPRLTAFLYLDDHPLATDPVLNGQPEIVDAVDDPVAGEKIRAIKKAVSASLPGYMVPSLFLLVSWLPRTASKKTDRKKIHLLGQRFYMGQRESIMARQPVLEPAVVASCVS